jgi:hypothetical protein
MLAAPSGCAAVPTEAGWVLAATGGAPGASAALTESAPLPNSNPQQAATKVKVLLRIYNPFLPPSLSGKHPLNTK